MAAVFPSVDDFGKITKSAKAFGKEATGVKGVLDKVGNAFRSMTGMADQAKNGLNQGRNALGQFTAAGEGLAGMGPYGMAIAAALTVATIAITATAGAMAALAGAAISVVEQRAGLLATFAALGGGAAAGKETLAMVDALSSKLPLPASQIAEIAKQMESAGFRGKALGKSIEAVAAATAIMHDASGGAAAQKMLMTLAEGGAGAAKMAKTIQQGGAKSNKMLQQMGLSTKDVTKALRDMGVKGTASADQVGMAVEKALAAKGKGPLEEMGRTFPAMAAKLSEGFFSLFEGLGPAVKPFMAALQGLFGQFGRGTGPMKALGSVATQALGTIFRYATMAVKAVSAFVKANFTAKNVGSTWTAIKSAIATVVTVLGKVWSVLGPIFKAPSFLQGIVFAFKAIAVGVGIAVAIWLAFGVVIGFIIGVVGNVLGVIGQAVGAIYDFVSSLIAGSSAGGSFVDGVVNGIVGGIGTFVAGVSKMASAGLAAFTSIFKIASPSAVMDKMGGHVAEGAAQGVEGGQDRVEGAASKLGAGMAGASAGAAGKGGGGSKATGKGGNVYNFAAGAIVVQGNGSVPTEEGLAIVLERIAATQGV